MHESEASRLRSLVALDFGRRPCLGYAPTELADGLAPDPFRRWPRNTATFAPTLGPPFAGCAGDSACRHGSTRFGLVLAGRWGRGQPGEHHGGRRVGLEHPGVGSVEPHRRAVPGPRPEAVAVSGGE